MELPPLLYSTIKSPVTKWGSGSLTGRYEQKGYILTNQYFYTSYGMFGAEQAYVLRNFEEFGSLVVQRMELLINSKAYDEERGTYGLY